MKDSNLLKYLGFFFIISVVTIISCENPPKPEGLIQNSENPQPAASSTEQNSTTPKTDGEIIAEAANQAIDIGKDVITNLKIRDSIRSANREQSYGYRIGFPIEDYDEAFEAYKSLTSTTNVYILKQSRKDYYLVYYNGKSKEELEIGMEEFRNTLPENMTSQIAIINLMDLCTNSKQKLMRGENLTKRKESLEIPCLICDK